MLAVSGGWIAHHGADFAWLQEKRAFSGALDIAWADHCYSTPIFRGLKEAQNYMLRPGVDLDREIFETEKLLIAHGETPSVFFRFPGLVADAALLEKLQEPPSHRARRRRLAGARPAAEGGLDRARPPQRQ